MNQSIWSIFLIFHWHHMALGWGQNVEHEDFARFKLCCHRGSHFSQTHLFARCSTNIHKHIFLQDVLQTFSLFLYQSHAAPFSVVECMDGERQCQPGNYSSKCIPNTAWCNGYPDCENGEDEEECGKIFIESRTQSGATATQIVRTGRTRRDVVRYL